MLGRQTADIRRRAGNSGDIHRTARQTMAVDLAIASSAVMLVHAAVVYSGLGAIIVGWAARNGVWNIEPVSLGTVLVILAAAWYGVSRRQPHTRRADAEPAASAYRAGVSHDLRTSLTGIIGFSELIANECFGPLGDARYAAYIEQIRADARDLLATIDGLHDLPRLEAAAGPRDEAPSDVGNAVRAAAR